MTAAALQVIGRVAVSAESTQLSSEPPAHSRSESNGLAATGKCFDIPRRHSRCNRHGKPHPARADCRYKLLQSRTSVAFKPHSTPEGILVSTARLSLRPIGAGAERDQVWKAESGRSDHPSSAQCGRGVRRFHHATRTRVSSSVTVPRTTVAM